MMFCSSSSFMALCACRSWQKACWASSGIDVGFPLVLKMACAMRQVAGVSCMSAISERTKGL